MTNFKFEVNLQEKYSRLHLLLRTFLGFIYIILPHFLVLLVFMIAYLPIRFINFFVILFTGKNWKTGFEWGYGMLRWDARISASFLDLTDKYPNFGLSHDDENVVIEIAEPEQVSRVSALLRLFFGWLYVSLPHGIILYFYALAVLVANFLNFFVILFTGKASKGLAEFQIGFLRWNYRVSAYLLYLTNEYPPFSNK